MKSHVFTANGLDNVIWWSSEKLCDDGKLIDMIFSREQGLPFQHLGEDAAGAPNIDLDIVLLPREHDLGRPVISRRDIAGHLRVLYASQAEVAYLQVTILIDKDVAGLEIAMNDSGRVDVF